MWSAQLPNSSAKLAAIGQTTCEWRSASYINAEAFVVQTGRYRSGQTGQTVNLLALRLRWFESSPAQAYSKWVDMFVAASLCRGTSVPTTIEHGDIGPWLQKSERSTPSTLFAGHLRDARRIRRRRHHIRGHHRRAVLVRVGELR